MAALLAGGAGTRGGCITGLDYTEETKQAQGEARGSRLGGACRGVPYFRACEADYRYSEPCDELRCVPHKLQL